MPVCITGMHRSGTSMVAKLLRAGGLWLGEDAALMPPSPDNQDGFYEHMGFVALNDEILESLGGWWDFPPPVLADGWEGRQLERLRPRLDQLAAEFEAREPWGWKDPRSSLTLPLWRRRWPGQKVVVCLRNPLEVAVSLRKRNTFSYALSLHLWHEYNRRLLAATSPADRIVTHYDAFFDGDARGEAARLVAFCGLDASEQAVRTCVDAAVSGDLRHNRHSLQDLLDVNAPREVVELYLEMCVEAGWMGGESRAALRPVSASSLPPPVAHAEQPSPLGAARLDRLGMLRRDLKEAQSRADELATKLAEQTAAREAIERNWQREAERLAQEKEAQLGELRAAMTQQVEAAEQRLRDAERQASADREERERRLRQADEASSALRRRIEEQEEAAGELRARAELIAQREQPLRKMLLEAHEQIIRHEDEFRHALEAAVAEARNKWDREQQAGGAETDAAEAAARATSAAKQAAYRVMVDRIRLTVQDVLPRDASVAVISKGDDALLDLAGRRACHFPQDPATGGYSGYSPASSADASALLAALEAKGVTHLLIPATSAWWLEYYAEWAADLDAAGARRVAANDDCVIFELSRRRRGGADTAAAEAKPRRTIAGR